MRACNNIRDVYDMDYDDLRQGWAAWSATFNERETNMLVYGDAQPRRFHAADVKIPVRLYYGEDDGYATASVRLSNLQRSHGDAILRLEYPEPV